jgi:hypothetical protein
MTINKSQSGTFDMVGLDATTPVFSHGQIYVALSSVRDFGKLTVLSGSHVVLPGVSELSRQASPTPGRDTMIALGDSKSLWISYSDTQSMPYQYSRPQLIRSRGLAQLDSNLKS